MNEQTEPTLVGDAPAFRRVLRTLQVVAATDTNVLVIGERGTGKETIAREILRQSPRAPGPFVAVTCSGMAEGELQTELYGRFAEAAGGTLFLDEVAELPPKAQVRLLHVVEGQGRLRVIAATSADLWSLVQSGVFRSDLYYRLYVVPLELPPLRARVQDIGPLVAHFVRTAAAAHGLVPPRFTATAERQLRRYAWPGNVRELRNFSERMVILCSGTDVGPDNLPWEIRRGEAAQGDVPFRLPASGIDLNALEAEVIRQALALAGGNKSRAARLLGLTRDTLLYRIQKYVIQA